MDTITFGLFQTQESAENAINELSRNGFSSKDISIIMKDQSLAKEFAKTTGSTVVDRLLEELKELGLAEEDAKIYEADIKIGHILLGIPTSDKTVKEILHKYQASQVRSINRNTM